MKHGALTHSCTHIYKCASESAPCKSIQLTLLIRRRKLEKSVFREFVYTNTKAHLLLHVLCSKSYFLITS